LWASKGIHLYTSKPAGGTGLDEQGTVITTNAALDLTQEGIVLAAQKKIELGVSGEFTTDESGNITGVSSNFSGIRLSDETGIWIGSENGIKLFSSSNTGSAADMTISPTEILFGVVGENNNQTSVVDIT